MLLLAAYAAATSGGGNAVTLEVVLLPAMIGLLLGVLLRLADRRHAVGRSTFSAADHRATDMASAVAKVRAATRSRHDALSHLAPELRPLVMALVVDRGIDPGDDTAARAVVGEELWRFVTDRRDPQWDRDRPGPTLDLLAAHLDRLESG